MFERTTMTKIDGRSSFSPRGAACVVLGLALLVAGCVNGQVGAGGTEKPTASPSGEPTATPTAGPPVGSFYLRAWQTQALAPWYTFSWLPVVTISGGQFINGMVAVPAIYPGPLWAGPSVGSISQKGIDTIVAEARKYGLLGASHDFATDMPPGSVLAHVEMIADGQKYVLSGDPSALLRCRCIPDPGTNAAFAAFWQMLSDIPGWLGAEVGQSAPYDPDRLAVLVTPPAEETSGIAPGKVDWPLATPFASFGSPLGASYRCGIVSGADLARLLPVVKQSNQLTRFVDSAGVSRSLQVRAVLPGEPSPCGG
jgi:hypothetical protein